VWQVAWEEDTPSAGWTSAEGGGYGVSPVSTDQGSREEETNRINIDDRYMRSGTCLSNAINYMPAMRLAQERAVVLTEKTMAPLGGRSGARNRGILWLPRGGNRAAGQGRKTPAVCSMKWYPRNVRARGMVLQISHALDAWLISV